MSILGGCQWLDLMTLEVFSNLNDSLILFQNVNFTPEGRLVSLSDLFKPSDIFNLMRFVFSPQAELSGSHHPMLPIPLKTIYPSL